MIDRRALLRQSGAVVATLGAASIFDPLRAFADTVKLPFENGERPLVKYPQKRPMIGLTSRPPQLETPFSAFNDGPITPNDAFFVRYHLAGIPLEIDPDTFTVEVKGKVDKPLKLSLAELKRMPSVEIAAVNQCSGNSRGFFEPRVAGGQLGNGAMGNARWKGARLKDVLAKASLKKEALEIVFDGADGPVMPGTPDFQKSIPVWKALDENTLIAYEMNGEPLPHWNGFPARIVVAGWTGTYWMKHVTSINAISKPFDNFWVKTGYRIPTNRFPLMEHFGSQMTDANEPITEMVVNSIITNVAPGQEVPVGRAFDVKGIAWDGGRGIATVDVSADGGRSWRSATLGADHGRFSFRSFSQSFTPSERGALVVVARASNRAGGTQTMELILNPAGYHHNVVQRIAISAV